jgi:hypothetical protein
MIEILEPSTPTTLGVRISGKVTGPDYQQFLDAVGERLKTGAPLNLVVELSDFEFYGDFEAAKMDFKFGFGEYKHIQKAAFVGDQKWIGWFTHFIGIFTRAEEKHFPAGQLDTAFQWACA